MPAIMVRVVPGPGDSFVMTTTYPGTHGTVERKTLTAEKVAEEVCVLSDFARAYNYELEVDQFREEDSRADKPDCFN